MADVIYNRITADKRKGVERMSPRTGRPTDNPKRERVTVRLDEKSSKILENYCRQESVEKAEAIRRGIERLEPDIKK